MEKTKPVKRVGIDFDNTIVCYDSLFHKVCLEKGLISKETSQSKSGVRNYLRSIGKEKAWTEIQGYVYGARMNEAEPFPGVIDFFKTCLSAGLEVCIISHKTRYPYVGRQYDLHQAAKGWLERNGFFNPDLIGLSHSQVFFELTKEEKLKRIGLQGCTLFIDDLPEFLADPNFPKNVQRILFDPNDLYAEDDRIIRLKAWRFHREALGC